MSSTPPQPGGFILSPPPSSVASSRSNAQNSLPHPRDSPLRPGGSKESAFIRYVDQRILHIQRRFAKRTTPSLTGEEPEKDAAAVWDSVKGYTSMREAFQEVGELVDVIWISGTPSLQIPYLINIALLLTTIIPAMPTTPKPLFRLLDKLDHAFASLLQGRDVDTGAMLPGLDGGRGVSGTEKVRLRSLVERTRRCVMEALKSSEMDLEYAASDKDDQIETEDEEAGDGELVLEGDDFDITDAEESWEMQIARVYDRTLVDLGDSLEEPSIGIITGD